MADNHRQDEIFELTEDMASAPTSPVGNGAVAAPPSSEPAAATRQSSIPPEPISPFQPLVDPNAPPEEEDVPVVPPQHKEPRPSFVPKPIPEAVKMSPIQNITGKTTSKTPPMFEKALAASRPAPHPTDAVSLKVEAPRSDPPKSVTAPSQESGSSRSIPEIPTVDDDALKVSPEGRPPALSSPPSHHPGAEVSSPPPVHRPPAVSSPPPHRPDEARLNENDVATVAAPKAYPLEEVEDISEEIDLMTADTTADVVALKAADVPETGGAIAPPKAESLALESESRTETTDLDEADAEVAIELTTPSSPSSSKTGVGDSATPEAVFDTVPAVAPVADETDLDGGADDDDAEELDLSEAEEMTHATPPAPPISGAAAEGRKPRLRRRQKPNKEWWARIFNDDYVSTIPKATVRGDQRKVNFIEKNLGVTGNALVLDLACGNGRHSVGMAKRGYRLVGIDLSLPMLAQAAELAQDEHQNINFIHGDMRDLSFDKTFDAIFCMGTSFGYFNEAENIKVLQGVFRALKPGGTFLIEVANRDHVITQIPDLTWFEGNGSVCMEESQFDFITSRLHVTRQLIMDGGRQVQNEISIRLYTLHELTELFRQTGFVIGDVSGHTATPGAFFGPDSVRIFITAQRPI